MLAPASYAKVKFGVEAGAYINKLKVNKDIVSSENRAGFFIGPKLKGSLALGFALLQPLGRVQHSEHRKHEEPQLHYRSRQRAVAVRL